MSDSVTLVFPGLAGVRKLIVGPLAVGDGEVKCCRGVPHVMELLWGGIEL